MLDLPGGGKARICVKRDTYADGTDFVGQGIRPTVEVKNTVAAVRNGTDPVLLEAQRLLGAVRGGVSLTPTSRAENENGAGKLRHVRSLPARFSYVLYFCSII
jgi:hypothetical protein